MDIAWEFTQELAVARCMGWQAQLHPAQPAGGLSCQQAESSAWTLFQIQPTPSHQFQLTEAYARDADLIVGFEQSPQDSFALQLHYRLLDPPRLLLPKHNAAEHSPPEHDTAEQHVSESERPARDWLGIELWLSVQTSLLDAAPCLSVSSSARAGQSWRSFSHAELAGKNGASSSDDRLAAMLANSDESSGVWLIDPADHRQVDLESLPEEHQQRLRLFGHFMEKGVIHRDRMRFHLCTGELTIPELQSLHHEFVESPLPLTA